MSNPRFHKNHFLKKRNQPSNARFNHTVNLFRISQKVYRRLHADTDHRPATDTPCGVLAQPRSGAGFVGAGEDSQRLTQPVHHTAHHGT